MGIQNTEFGESVPDFWDIFDFEVGDVFQKYYYYCPFWMTCKQSIKTEVLSKEVFSDHYSYEMKILCRIIEEFSGGNTITTYSSNITNQTFYKQDYPDVINFQMTVYFYHGIIVKLIPE
ncbi:MAG: hypothetical protein R2764_02570 [Bacteroidales bacterium]